MEVKEAADLLDNLIGMIEDSGGRDYDTALKMGIEALSAQPEIIACGQGELVQDGSRLVQDCIDRQAEIDALARTAREKFNLSDEFNHYLAGLMDGEMAIRQLPSAQPTEASCWGCNCPKMERLKVQKTFSEMVHLHDAEPQWIPCSETEDLPKHEVLCCDKYGEELIGWLSYSDDQWLCESDCEMMYDPIAWRELPEPWRGEEP